MAQGKVTASSLNLRTEPKTSADTIKALPTGTVVNIIRTLAGENYSFSGSTRNDWHEVKVDGDNGFVAAAFVSSITSPPPISSIKEIRGVWIVDHAHSSVLTSPTNITNALNFLQAHGFNTVFPAVWNRGFTAFPSDVMVSHGFPKQDNFYASKGFDPLQEIVSQGKSRGMAVIPWFEFGFAASPDTDGGHILQNKPQWSALDSAGNKVRHGGLTWMNSLNPEVQQFMLDLILEVIQKYNVDGIQGDDRFPAMPFNAGYDAETKDKFRAKHGTNPPNNGKDAKWVQFRADLLTQYLKTINAKVEATKPSCIVSMSPAPFPFGRDNLMQDSDTWVKQNLVDFLHPQLYRQSFNSPKPDLSKYKPEIEGSRTIKGIKSRFIASELKKIAPGIAFTANGVNLTSSDIVEIVKLNRNNGLGGQVFFFYEGLTKNSNQIAIALQSQANYNQVASLPSPIVIT